MTDWIGFVDDRRTVLRMSGAQARTVLQDVVTNNVEGASATRAVYAALLTPQGKYLHDLFILDQDGDLLLDVEAARAEGLVTRLRMYCMRRDAKVELVPEFAVTLIWSEVADAAPEAGTGLIVADPRDTALGWRAYGPVAMPLLPSDRLAYDQRRLGKAVPEGGQDLLPDETYILEAGFERLNGVDFSKGCYVGQEVTARMKHKTELRKGLVQVVVEGTAPVGTEITSGGKVAGKLLSNAGGIGLAHLRFDRASDEMAAGDAVVRYTP